MGFPSVEDFPLYRSMGRIQPDCCFKSDWKTLARQVDLLYSNSSMTIPIRPLTDPDLEAADTIIKLAFRSSAGRSRDLQLYRRIQPDGWFVAAKEDQPVGMVGATNYGTIAHVGLMAVHPDAQRQGIGMALMQFLLARLDQQHVPLVTLDASEMGRPLYDKLGFVPYDETLKFEHHGNFANLERPSNIQSISIRELDELARWDSTFFGANRHEVLQALLSFFPGRGLMLRDGTGQIAGYLFAQGNRIGPWVMRPSRNAEALLQAALALPFEGTLSLDVPEVNQDAMVLLQRYGFEQRRANRHMGRGQSESPGLRKQIYAQASLAIG
jgi:GNAT superfamily N-acetyltransferase